MFFREEEEGGVGLGDVAGPSALSPGSMPFPALKLNHLSYSDFIINFHD